ncbi:MAG: hypothetical protein DRN95_06880 [Candidatus Hydrothermarchaeota archaeon]|nr:MAG: hypothetical protein DRN95_06880 [Candidatus Hydrothermarchaeota archaeon]
MEVAVNLSVIAGDSSLESVINKVIAGEKGAKSQLIDTLANHIVDHYHIVTSPQWNLYCYANGVYVECENDVRQLIEEYGSFYGVSHHITTRVVNEIIEKVKRLTYRSPADLEPSRWYLALENGLLNVKKWVTEGELTLEEYNPKVFKRAKINAEFTPPPEGMNEDNWFEYGPKLCPNIHNAFVSWVGPNNARLLYEIVGYCLWPDYPIHVAFMLVGEGSNGKSTFINLLRTFLGHGNYASIPLQLLTTNRFLIGELYGKLANVFPDLPKTPLINTGIFKALTGQDEVYADIKHKKGFSFVNYAKMICSANELPAVTDNTYAFWRRWVVVEFPNRFPPDPNFIHTFTTRDELNGLLIMTLHALRALLKRGSFTVVGDFKETWLRRANSVYAFIQDMVEFCGDTRDCYTPKDELYAAYADWCADNDVTAVSQTKFTQEFKRLTGSKARLGKVREGGKLTRVWYGVRLKYEVAEEEEPVGLQQYLEVRGTPETETKDHEDRHESRPEELAQTPDKTPSPPLAKPEATTIVGRILIVKGCVEESVLFEEAEKQGLTKDEAEAALAKLISLGLVEEVPYGSTTQYCPK